MSGYQLFLSFLGGYVVFLVITGLHFSRRQTSAREFMLGGRRAGPIAIGFSAAASWLTAGAILAVTGFFMLLGMGSVWGFVAPNIISLLVIALLVVKIRSVPAMTQPELLEIRYGSCIRMPVALIIITVMILFAVSDIKGFALVLKVFYGIDGLHAAMIVGGCVAVYVSLGGLSAVIATDGVQFCCLALLVLFLALAVSHEAVVSTGIEFRHMVVHTDRSWWNPLSVGIPMVLIFCCAIIPGWVTEQDPWQKIWAARDAGSARKGMVIGAVLITAVFGGCAVIAMGLNNLYPGIAKLGFPAGMAQAEPALLDFVLAHFSSDFIVAICAVALATAAMSCADTFSASGASCISRDIYQRFINPSASTARVVLVNRVSVVLIVGCATAGSLYIDSIIEAIHIATFIASSSYFFLLMGGLYWKRATGAGAVASLYTGFCTQTILVIIDKAMTEPAGIPYLESLHPVLMGHGVIAAMLLSGLVFVFVSLITVGAEQFRLAPFFPEAARTCIPVEVDNAEGLPAGRDIKQITSGRSVYLSVDESLPDTMSWADFVRDMASRYRHWYIPAGKDTVRRYAHEDVFSCVAVVSGVSDKTVTIEIEGASRHADELKTELASGWHEIRAVILPPAKGDTSS